MVYFILPYQPKKWKTERSGLVIDYREYRQRFLDKWMRANVYEPPRDAPYILRWKITDEEGRRKIAGGLQRDMQTVSIEPADGDSLASFVIWHRIVVPYEFKLYLTWEGIWDSLELTEKTTAEDIFHFTGLID